jgi:carnitine 3-dehydrogenase
MTSPVKTLGIVGTGVIGAGWAARALAWGLDVVASDPGKDAEKKLRAAVDNAWPALAKLGLADGASTGRLRFVGSVADAVKDADFIQESAPERIELKQKLHQEISRHAKADALIASSSSGLLPTEIQEGTTNPGRILIGHPFNPVYLLPLVELVGGKQTTPDTIERARAFYASIGMHPLHVRNEIDGYLSDRLQEAVWREILHLVNDGVATTRELDEAIAFGPGLRWAFWGTNLIFHLAGGDDGMRHMLHQFGPALKLPWTKLVAPELNDRLIDRMVEGTQEQAGNRTIKELERQRDEALIAVMQALKPYNVGAGRIMVEYEARMQKQRHAERWKPGAKIAAAPLELSRGYVKPDWIDYNGHMTEGAYIMAIGDASDALFRYIGIDEAYRAAGHSYYTIESHATYAKEVGSMEPLVYKTQILGLDAKRLHLFHAMRHGKTDELLFTCEQMLLHVDTRAGKAAEIPPGPEAALDAIWQVHRHLPAPKGAGRAIGQGK